MQELWLDPAFVAAIRTAKTKVVGNYWASPEWERVNKATGGAAAGPGHGVIALGGDFFQPYNSKQHSTGGIWWRYAIASLLLYQLLGECYRPAGDVARHVTGRPQAQLRLPNIMVGLASAGLQDAPGLQV